MVQAAQIIQRKRDGYELTKEDIEGLIHQFCDGRVPDYQMSAWLMAVYFKGMSAREVADLTMAMAESGNTVDLSMIRGVKVDKHSTGGVGDKTTLIVAPLAAAAGVPVAKMSGRGLGFTGGTVDKLESIPGFRCDVSMADFISLIERNSIAVVSQTENVAPADKNICFARRHSDGRFDPINCKLYYEQKIALGADAIVFDVKVGHGAFMKTMEEARSLAQTMVDIGRSVGKKTVAILSNMNEPLGFEVGNANEIKEVIRVLKGEHVPGLTELSVRIAGYMAWLGGIYEDIDKAMENVEQLLKNGKAYDKFVEFIQAQGGDAEVIADPSRLPAAQYKYELRAEQSGYVAQLHAEQAGKASMLLGAGRMKKDDQIDHAAGITLHKKVGDYVNAGESICTFYSNKDQFDQAVQTMLEGLIIAEQLNETDYRMIYETIGMD